MESILEYRFIAFLFRLRPPVICLCEYFGIFIMVLMLILVDCPWIVTALIILAVMVGVAMLPLWYKTFFDRNSVGLDQPFLVQWSDEVIRFRGAYFDIEVPVSNVLGYKAIGLRSCNTAFVLKMKVKKASGVVERMWLSTTMPRKKEFIDFLDQHRTTG